MDSLNNSTFFDGRTLEFLRKLLMNNGRIAPLSGNEQKFLDRREEITNLNEALEYSLIRNLSEYKSYVPVIDAVFFLLEAHSRDLLVQADAILQMAVREKQTFTAKELSESLEEIQEMTPDWIVNILGNNTGDRHAKNPVAAPSSSLNLEAMRNFK